MAIVRQYVLSLSYFRMGECQYQSRRADNQTKLQSDFQFIFTALNTLGHDMNAMIDCSEVIPAPKPVNFGPATLPAGKTHNDIEQAVSHASRLDAARGLTESSVRLDPLPIPGYRPWPGHLCCSDVSRPLLYPA